MANSDEINVLSICVDLLDGLDGSAAHRISTFLNNKYAESLKPSDSKPILKKRGRPAKAALPAIGAGKKKRGRPAKAITLVVGTEKKRRGRPKKSV